ADRFAQIDHRLMQEVYDRVVVAIEASQTCRIICPDGTDLQGAVSFPDGGDELTDFAVEPFPVMIFPPVDCLAMSGQLSLAHWLTSSSTNIYEGSVFTPRSPVMAQLEEGIITEFVGEAGEAARIKAHFERVGAMAGGNPFAVNSWHTGINPRNYSTNQPGQDLERWSNAVFGSPRFTHFHACGTDPGDIAISLFDATISFDGEAFWQDGRFAFLDWPEMQELLQRYPGNEDAFEMRWDIGFERSNAA
ncbi:MAG: hypothetical protein HN577_02065, partial [Rhodospirillaceae bacterium]|nr:hypothetical protein [Rhodospirillaceae bacterium]